MKDKKEKVQKVITNIKEAWKDPRKKAGIKLLSYLLFFVIFLLIAGITSRMSVPTNNYDYETTTTTTQVVDKYKDKQEKLLKDKYNINYVIKINNKEYKINGIINNKIIDGYLENNDNIKKILFKDNNLFEIKNKEEIILETEINKDLINVDYIINLIKDSSVIKEQQENNMKYTYDINDKNLKVVIETNEEDISKINITNENNTYEMIFDK